MKLFNWGKKFRSPAQYFYPSSGWGNAINVKFDRNSDGGVATAASVTGWQSPRPVDGDVYIMPMESGKDTVWAFTEVRHMADPNDMFFAKLKFVGYMDELDMPKKIERSEYL